MRQNLRVLLLLQLVTLGCCVMERSCGDCAVDLLLVIDSYIEEPQGQTAVHEERALKDFLYGLVEQIPLSDNKTKIGVIEFEETVKVLAHLGSDHETLVEAFENLNVTKGNTDMFGALQKSLEILHSADNRDNAKYKDIVLMITDGKQTSRKDEVIQKANEIRHTFGAKIIVVGVTPFVDAPFLSQIADNGELYFNVGNFSVLKSIMCRIKVEACMVPNIRCDLDVAIAIDMSGSVQSASAVDKVRIFGNDTVTKLMELSPRMRLALIEFKDNVTLKADLNNYNSSYMRKQILSLTPGGWTCTACALNMILNKVFNGKPESGDRVNASDVVVIVTDGLPTRTLNGVNIKETAANRTLVENEVKQLANRLRNNNVSIISVIVKGKMGENWGLLQDISTTVLKVDNFDGLRQVMDRLSRKVCEAPNKLATIQTVKRLIEKREVIERYLDVESESGYSRIDSNTMKERMESLIKEYLDLDN